MTGYILLLTSSCSNHTVTSMLLARDWHPNSCNFQLRCARNWHKHDATPGCFGRASRNRHIAALSAPPAASPRGTRNVSKTGDVSEIQTEGFEIEIGKQKRIKPSLFHIEKTKTSVTKQHSYTKHLDD